MTERVMMQPGPERRAEQQQVEERKAERQAYEVLTKKAQDLVRNAFEQNLMSVAAFRMGQVMVNVTDYQSDAVCFYWQQRVLEAYDMQTPVINLRAQSDEIRAPIDFGLRDIAPELGDVNTSQEYPLETVTQLLNHKYDTTLDVLSQGGAHIGLIPREEARSSFFHGISRSIVTRFKSLLQTQITPQVNPALPLDAVVSVITDEHRQLVTYCRGHFASTGQAFGYSTPARRSIGHGWYMFGLYTNSGPKFMDILFEVPAQTEIYLQP